MLQAASSPASTASRRDRSCQIGSSELMAAWIRRPGVFLPLIVASRGNPSPKIFLRWFYGAEQALRVDTGYLHLAGGCGSRAPIGHSNALEGKIIPGVGGDDLQVIDFGNCSDLPVNEGWGFSLAFKPCPFRGVPLGSCPAIRKDGQIPTHHVVKVPLKSMALARGRIGCFLMRAR